MSVSAHLYRVSADIRVTWNVTIGKQKQFSMCNIFAGKGDKFITLIEIVKQRSV